VTDEPPVPGPRFVLRYRGQGALPDADVARVAGLPATVLDTSPRMLLVEADPEALRALVDSLPDWVMAPEQGFPLPDTRKRALRPPEPDSP
jgi:hypothetical protein